MGSWDSAMECLGLTVVLTSEGSAAAYHDHLPF